MQHTNLLSGTVASGATLSHVPTPTGTLVSVPGFTPEINAQVVFGADHLYTDADGSKLRVNVSFILKYISKPVFSQSTVTNLAR